MDAEDSDEDSDLDEKDNSKLKQLERHDLWHYLLEEKTKLYGEVRKRNLVNQVYYRDVVLIDTEIKLEKAKVPFDVVGDLSYHLVHSLVR